MTILDQLSSQIGERCEEANRNVASQCLADPALLKELATGFEAKDDKLIADCAEVMTFVSEQRPDWIIPYTPYLTHGLSSKNTRVRWESMHALAFVAEAAPDVVLPIVDQLDERLKNDKSIIVRDYAARAAGNIAKAGVSYAQKVYPVIKSALIVWEGRHAHHAMQGLECVVSYLPEQHEELKALVEPLIHHKKKVIQKAAKSLLNVLDSE